MASELEMNVTDGSQLYVRLEEDELTTVQDDELTTDPSLSTRLKGLILWDQPSSKRRTVLISSLVTGTVSSTVVLLVVSHCSHR